MKRNLVQGNNLIKTLKMTKIHILNSWEMRKWTINHLRVAERHYARRIYTRSFHAKRLQGIADKLSKLF